MKIIAVLSLLFAPILAADLPNVADHHVERIPEEDIDELVDAEHEGGRQLRGHPTIEGWVVNRGAFSTLTDVLIAAGLAPGGPLSGSGPFTLFAPSNNAFAWTFSTYPGLDAFLLDPANSEALEAVLTYHVLAAQVFSRDIPRSGVTVSTLQGDHLTAFKHCYRWYGYRYCDVYLRDGSPDLAYVTHADNRASNGVIHAIDKVLIPPSLAPIVEGLRRGH